MGLCGFLGMISLVVGRFSAVKLTITEWKPSHSEFTYNGFQFIFIIMTMIMIMMIILILVITTIGIIITISLKKVKACQSVGSL